MSPNLESQMPESPDIESNNEYVYLTLTPLTDLSVSTTPSEETHSDSDSSSPDLPDQSIAILDEQRSYLPLEHNIRGLLVKVSNTEHLETVTQIKLRVIARDLALQQLGVYLPSLRELILDGSVVSSLRDLGNGLKNLKILKVNRCQLPCIDGVLGLEDLEEIYAADNDIKDLSSCAFLSNLRVVDVRRNSIKHLGSLSFLNLCVDLTHLLLQGNEAAADDSQGYRQTVKRILPNLRMLDGAALEQHDSHSELVDNMIIEDLEDDACETEDIQERVMFTPRRTASLSRPNLTNPEASGGFTVRFPPKVCNGNRGKSP